MSQASRQSALATAHLSLFVAASFWAGAYVVGDQGLQDIPADLLTLLRWGPGAIVLGVFYRKSFLKLMSFSFNDWVTTFWLASTGVFLYPWTLFKAVQNGNAITATLYLALTPAVICLIGIVFRKTRAALSTLIAICSATIGGVVMVYSAFMQDGSSEGYLSGLWAPVSMLCWASYCATLDKAPKNLNEGEFLTLIVMLGSMISFVFFMFGYDNESVVSFWYLLSDGYSVALSLFYFAVFPSLVAFFLYARALDKVGALAAGVYNNLVPVLGTALALIFTNESPTIVQLLGSVFVFASIAIFINQGRREN